MLLKFSKDFEKYKILFDFCCHEISFESTIVVGSGRNCSILNFNNNNNVTNLYSANFMYAHFYARVSLRIFQNTGKSSSSS